MKIVHNTNKDTYSIKGLSNLHVEILDKLCSEVILGDGIYKTAAFELCEMFELSEEPICYDYDIELKISKKGITFVDLYE